MTGGRALEQSIIALCVEQALPVKARLLKAVVHICSNDKIILILHQSIQSMIHRLRSIHITVDKNVSVKTDISSVEPLLSLAGKRNIL